MDVAEAYKYVTLHYPGKIGRFYAPGVTLGLGKGCIYKQAIYAVFDDERQVYRTSEGVAYLLTHECDIDPANDRMFNSDLLVCPLIPFENLVSAMVEDGTPSEKIASFLSNLGARNIPRLIYLPPIQDELHYGGVMFLNQTTTAPADLLRQRGDLLCAVTAFGLQEVEYALENHLLRPKADRLSLS